jgi:phage terminase large subunit GpA-like protein
LSFLANPARLGHEAAAAALTPPPPIDYLKWAVDNVVFETGSFPGPYNPTNFPYFSAVLDALSPADPCRYVSLVASAQCGKTVLGGVFALGSMVMGRGTTLVCHPVDDNAIRWSKMKLPPLMRSIPAVQEAFPQRSRDASSGLRYKARADGLADLLITGANSPATLSQITVNYQVQDDLSKWENNSAGDPETQADNRSRAVEFAKVFKVSTPLVLPGCRITKDFEAGSQEMPFVPCPHCAHMQVLEWDNMLAVLDPEYPEDAHFTCIACGCIIEERHRPQMLAGFEWRARNPSAAKEHRSFWTKDDRQDNEALDTMVQATGAALKFGVYGLADVGWARLEAERVARPGAGPLRSRPSLASQLAH